MRIITWMTALALAGICVGQQSEEEKRYYADFERSENQAIAEFPDAANAASPLSQKIAQMDNALAAVEDDLYYSADKPLMLARLAAKELGIMPVGGDRNPILERRTTEEMDSRVNSEFKGFEGVTIRKIEPDGLRIIHESGAAKIPIENLTGEQRANYGLTMEGADRYRREVASNTAAYCARQREAARQAQLRAEAAAEAEWREQEQIRANPPKVVQAPVWKRFVNDENFRKANRDGIAEEIRQQDGDVAAERFLREEQAKDMETARNDSGRSAGRSPSVRRSTSATYQRIGNRITINGNTSSGYRIKGNQLIEVSTGRATHVRSGNSWVPLDSSHPTIRDPD